MPLVRHKMLNSFLPFSSSPSFYLDNRTGAFSLSVSLSLSLSLFYFTNLSSFLLITLCIFISIFWLVEGIEAGLKSLFSSFLGDKTSLTLEKFPVSQFQGS